MKINTDGVLLGALAYANDPKSILDIGTGTGVIVLMMAQRFEHAQIDAVEIDPIRCGQPVQDHPPFVRHSAAVGRHPPALDETLAVPDTQHDVGVADVDE